MGLVILGSDMLAGEMGIHLCRGDTGVTKKLLNVPQRCAAPQEVGREAVPQRVRRYLCAYAGLARMAL